MATLEKQQVVSFLKILEIPVDKSPEEIKKLLLEAGWNEADAIDAVRVLHPSQSVMSSAPQQPPRMIAQKYTPPPIPKPVQATPDTISEAAPVESESDVPAPAPIEVEETQAEERVTPEAAAPEMQPQSAVTEESTVEEVVPESVPQPEFIPTPDAVSEPVPAEDTVSEIEAVPQLSEVETKPPAEKSDIKPFVRPKVSLPEILPEPEPSPEKDADRPHTDAPWLRDQVDIYDVTPEEREEMIRTVYRTNERLTPQTIHALLGIDVDLTEYEERFERMNRNRNVGEPSVLQIIIIMLLAIIIAAAGMYVGMYYFEVGLFHPTMNHTGN